MGANGKIITAYRGVQQRMTALVRELDEDGGSTVVPATPDWQLRDLLAHVVGVTADVVAGRIAGAGSDPWTAAQVTSRRGRSTAELLAEWEAGSDAFAEALRGIDPFPAAQAVFDAATHEHDLRGALDAPGARDSDAVEVGWGWATAVLGQVRDGHGAGALELRTPEGTTVAGSGEVTGAVEAERFELWRAMTGRRSPEQVSSWRWEGEPAVAHLCLLPARSTPLLE